MIHPKEDAKKTLEYCKKFKQLRLATQHQRQKQSAGNEAFDKRLCWFMESKHGQKLEIKDGTESEKEPRKTLLTIIATAINSLMADGVKRWERIGSRLKERLHAHPVHLPRNNISASTAKESLMRPVSVPWLKLIEQTVWKIPRHVCDISRWIKGFVTWTICLLRFAWPLEGNRWRWIARYLKPAHSWNSHTLPP